MKILFSGGGTGGHFYPIVAVIEALRKIVEEKKIIEPELVFVSDSNYEKGFLYENGVRLIKINSGKIRSYLSPRNILDFFKTIFAVIKSMIIIYREFPDVIFSKGGYTSFPVVLAARIFGIPLIIHESDTIPGKVNRFSGKFAQKIAISFAKTAEFFPKEKVALVGNPVRRDFFVQNKDAAKRFLNIQEGSSIIFIQGGSQGAQRINEVILSDLVKLLDKYQIIHQCGTANYNEVKSRADVILEGSDNKDRYHLFDFLNRDALHMALYAADIVISRAGSGAIAEIAAAGVPSILIPLPESAQDHQRENAYAYASSGAADVIEQENVTPNVLLAETERILTNKEKMEKMKTSAKAFARPDSAELIAQEILNLALAHSK